MLQPSKIAPGLEQHEEIFLERYKRLRAWALQITENDREQAEDLVHDTYVQFTLTRPDLNAIGNLNGYLYTMMRNLHVSQLRRSLRRQGRTLSIIDYDSAEMGLRAADPREQMKVQEALRQICQYACMRKQTSKAGSVLILRFLHGYYPREIALVMRSASGAWTGRPPLHGGSALAKELLMPNKNRLLSARRFV
jgi:RNA polymerase sigma factor (sigma-70 family)